MPGSGPAADRGLEVGRTEDAARSIALFSSVGMMTTRLERTFVQRRAGIPVRGAFRQRCHVADRRKPAAAAKTSARGRAGRASASKLVIISVGVECQRRC